MGGRAGLTVTHPVDDATAGQLVIHIISKPGVIFRLPSESGRRGRVVARIKRVDSVAKRVGDVEKHVGLGAAASSEDDKESSED